MKGVEGVQTEPMTVPIRFVMVYPRKKELLIAPLTESDQPYCSAIGTIATDIEALSIEQMRDTAAHRATTTL